MALDDQLPVIDLSLPYSVTASRVHVACSTTGFFYVTNHGIPQELIDRAFEQFRRLFALPMEEKQRMRQDKNNRGYLTAYSETLDLAGANRETKERFYIGVEDPPGDVPLMGPNQWPDPETLPEFRPVVEEFYAHACQLCRDRILALLLASLGLEPTVMYSMMNVPRATLGALHYFADISDPDNGIFAAGAHRDYGLLTFIATHDVNGLQVQIGDAWVDVPHRDGALVVNLGEMMACFTNGLYKAALHRVITLHGKERYSLPFFYDPDLTAVVQPCPELCKDGDQKFEPVVFSDFLLGKYSTTNADYAG